jgi:hypothetical protein
LVRRAKNEGIVITYVNPRMIVSTADVPDAFGKTRTVLNMADRSRWWLRVGTTWKAATVLESRDPLPVEE